MAHFTLGQHKSTDSAFLVIAKKNAIRSYTATPNASASLFNGFEYLEYRPVKNEHPYLELGWVEGTISYSGKQFEYVPLLYDLSIDAIVTEHSSGKTIALIKERVDFFILNGHRYEFLNAMGLAPGFYDVLYSGTFRILAKREKIKQQILYLNTSRIEFDEKVRYYIYFNEKFSSLSSKRSLVKLLSAKNPKIKKALESESKNESSQKEEAFVRLAKLYDQLDPSWQKSGH
jgi:hypothetical protein